ncbi:Wzz/FepE/Etk N-terminal domain-containing protein [Sporosarcina sp. FSL K6-2383]|uniref:Wzz/FepE/Etk N-terminal domain-containing protein n=1 Tax=Sporosarcina sp. FSL K6-2383 TaxID=2921556 RepID=UPI00315A79D8
MEETIELRELIETVWKGKWIIAGLTALFMLIAGGVSWFVLPEQFESKATVQVASEVQDTGIMASYVAAEFTPVIFSQRIKNESLMNEAFVEQGINEKLSMDDISATVQANTNIVDLKYTSTSAEKAQEHLELFINKTKERMNTSVKRTLTELEKTYTSEANQLSGEIESLIEQYNKLIVSNELPEMLVLQTLVNSQIIMTVSDAQSQALSNVNGALHNELMQMQAQVESKSTEYRKVLDKYQSVKTGLDSFRPDPFIRTIVEPTIPENPSAPSKLLNVAIAMIIGLMAGLGIVFFRQYWRNSSPTK